MNQHQWRQGPVHRQNTTAASSLLCSQAAVPMSSGEETVSSCLGRAAVPLKRVWRGLSARLARRRRRTTTGKLSTTYVPVNPDDDDRRGTEGTDGTDAGAGVLRKDVRSCEYRDVHVMWEMLSGRGGGSRDDGVAGDAAAVDAGKGAPGPWSRLVTCCCAF